MVGEDDTGMASEKTVATTYSAPESKGGPPRGTRNSASSATLEAELSNTTITPRKNVSPEGGYGWVCVACCFFINGHTWGINSTYGVFLSYYLSHTYFPNTSALAYAFIGGLSMSMALLIAPLATRSIHTFGTHMTLYIGVFFETLALLSSSFAKKKWQIVLSQGVCFGWGMGFLFVGSVGIIPQWFAKRRSVANAISAAGSGLGGLMYSLVAQRCIDRLGLPWTFRILAVCVFVVNTTAATIIRDRNKAVGSKHVGFDFAMLKRPEYLLLQGWAFFSLIGYTILLFSVASYATTIGLSAQQGSIVSALLNLGQMLGRPLIGLASDRYGRINLAASLSAICGILCFILWIPTELCANPMGLLTFFVIVGGALAGTFWCTIAAVGAEVVGLKDLPAALSMTWVLLVPPTTVAEPIALELRRKNTKSFIFLYAQVFTALCYLAGACCLWVVRGWKVGEMEAHERHLVLEMRRSILLTSRVETQLDSQAAKEGWEVKGLVRRMWKWTVV